MWFGRYLTVVTWACIAHIYREEDYGLFYSEERAKIFIRNFEI